MQKVILYYFALLGLTLFSCNQSQPAQEDQEAAFRKKAAAERFRNRQATGPMRIDDETLQLIWPAYEQLRDALVVKDLLRAREAALMIAEGTRGKKGYETIYHAAIQTIGAANATQQRSYFSPMSNAMIDLVKIYGMEEGKVFIAFCPMAFDDQGAYWLTAQRKVINPYFGDEMLTCGSISETIEQAGAPK